MILAFLAVWAVVYYIAPVAIPTFEPTGIQSAAITIIAFVIRAMLAREGEDE